MSPVASGRCRSSIITRPAERSRTTAIACSLDHPAHDGFCLDLAERLGAPLVTADSRLVDKLRSASDARFASLVLPLPALLGVLGGG